MNWEDECYLLSKRKFRENANIINVFSLSKGKVSGIVYGGNSRKIRNFLPNLGALDISPVVLLFLIWILKMVMQIYIRPHLQI